MSELKNFLSSNSDSSLVKVFEALEVAAVRVSREVTIKGLGEDIHGAHHSENSHGEQQQKLDLFADDQFQDAFRKSGVIAGLASEEIDEAIQFDENLDGDYIVMIDPLDGSSNIDVNVAIGTIFAIYERVSETGAPLVDEDFLQSGRHIVAAGYLNYSVSTQFVISTGQGVHIFTLDPLINEFHLVDDNVEIPEDGKFYAINEVNFDDFDKRLKDFIQYCRDKRKPNGNRMYTGRYIGSLVADFHRNLLKGGIYVYPATVEAPQGKLRLLYEGNPMAFLIEQAGGYATDGNVNILDIVPTELHQKCPLYVGSKVMMDEVMGE